MGCINKVILVGNVGQDPDVKTFNDATVVTLSVATSESWIDKTTSKRMEKTEWHRVVIFNETVAQFVSKFVKKGSKVYVEGHLQTNKWQDKSGMDRYSTDIILSSFKGDLQLLDRKAVET